MGKQTCTLVFLLFLTGNLIAQSGNVGIGTSNPLEKLHLSGGNLLLDRGTSTSGLTRSITLGGARFASGGDYGSILFQNLDSNNGNTDYIGARISSQNTNGTDDGDLRFSTYNGTLLERMVILSNGLVGIGNSSPTSLFSVGDDLNAPTLGGTRISVSDQDNVSGLNVGEDGNNRGWLLWDNTQNAMFMGTRSAGTQYNNSIYIKDGAVAINTSETKSTMTVSGGENADYGPILSFLGSDPDQFEAGRIRFLDGIGAGNLRGGYIHHDGVDNLFHIGVHVANGNDPNDEVNAITIDRVSARVGIGTDSPSERLHVSGGNLLIDRGNTSNGLTRTLSIRGARSEPGSSYAMLNFQNIDDNNTNTNYTGARITSTNASGTDGGDLRFYTNGGSLSQKMVIEPDGNVGIGLSNPSQKLQVDGNIRTSGEIQRSSTGASNLVPICYGQISFGGNIFVGTGNFIVSNPEIGEYQITITGENFSFVNYVVTATLAGNPGTVTYNSINGNLLIKTYNLVGGLFQSANRDFSFVVYKL